MRRRAVLVCLAAGGRTLGAYRGKIRIVYSEWCKIRSCGMGESGGWLEMDRLVSFTYVTLWVEDMVPGTEVRVGVLGGKTQDVTLIISTELCAVKLAEALEENV